MNCSDSVCEDVTFGMNLWGKARTLGLSAWALIPVPLLTHTLGDSEDWLHVHYRALAWTSPCSLHVCNLSLSNIDDFQQILLQVTEAEVYRTSIRLIIIVIT